MTHDEPVIRRPAKPGDKAGPRPRVYVYGAVGAAVAVVVVVVLLIVLGGDDGVVDPGWLDDAASGKVVYCSGEDVSGSQQRSVADFNASPEHGTAHAVLAADIPPKADRQRAEYLKRIRSHDCDVVYLDVIYTPEFASTDLLYDMTPYLERDDLASSFDSKMISTATYGGKLWGVPKQLDAGLLYYRRDKVRRGPPATWRALVKAAKPGRGELPGLRLQLDAYEGLTVTFLELAYAAGADPIVSDDGKADLDQPGTLKALELLHDAIVDRAVPGSVTRLAEENSLDLFSLGRAKFLRGWPYVEARVRGDAEHAAQTDSPSAQARRNTVFNLGVASLPPWTVGGRHVAILGGHNLVIPRKAKNPQGALHLIKFLTSDQQILRDARKASLAPVVPALNDNDAVRSSPALMAVQDDDLRLRPPITSYWRVSRAISTRLRQVLNNRQAKSTFPQELRDLQADVQRELDQ
jgi:multiple sugar transport system substrate-binding protein